MLLLLSPAKSLDYETPAKVKRHTLPQFVADSHALIQQLRTQTPAQLASLMDLSDKLAELNVARFAAWQPEFTADNSKQAVLAFNGDVYEGLDAATLTAAQLDWAQDHLLILSGLYGLLRPLDWMQPYRLEMGTTWPNPRGKDLYAWWGNTLTEHVNARLQAMGDDLLVNLASQEYFKAINKKVLKAKVVDCVFEDWKSGQWKVISFHAKRARGLMVRHIISRKGRTLQALRGFSSEGYAWVEEASTPGKLVFRRKLAD